MPTPAQEEEWEDASGSESEEDSTLNNPDVVMKYKRAAAWANESLEEVIRKATVGTPVAAVCAAGDAAITARVSTAFRGVEKGAAFPTCVSLNNCVCNNSPVPDEVETPQVIAEGDVVHIELGVHIDGYCVVVAHTLRATAAAEGEADSKASQVIAAALATLNVAMRSMRPGNTTYSVTDILERSAKHFGLTVVDGVLSHMMKRYIIDSVRAVAGKRAPEQLLHEYTFEAGQVWTLDVALTTGKGKLRELDGRCGVYKPSIDASYNPKMQAAREVLSEVNDKFQTFPFAVRCIENKKVRLGLTEMVKHGVMVPFAPLFEREGETVARFCVTLLITNKKIERITGIIPQKPAVQLAPFDDPMLIEASKLTLTLAAKGATKKEAETPEVKK